MKMDEVKTWLDAFKHTLERKCIVVGSADRCSFCKVANESAAAASGNLWASGCRYCPLAPKPADPFGVNCVDFWRKIKQKRRIGGAKRIIRELEARPGLKRLGIRRLIREGLVPSERKVFRAR